MRILPGRLWTISLGIEAEKPADLLISMVATSALWRWFGAAAVGHLFEVEVFECCLPIG